jgi:hypothetical protein
MLFLESTTVISTAIEGLLHFVVFRNIRCMSFKIYHHKKINILGVIVVPMSVVAIAMLLLLMTDTVFTKYENE